MENKHQEDLSHIRQMMERSTRFMSLSGLSGVIAGVVALLSVTFVYFLLKHNGVDYFDVNHIEISTQLFMQLFLIAVCTISLASGLAYYFTWKKGRHIKEKVWTSQGKRMFFHLALPLLAGAVLAIALAYHHLFVWIAPITLLFYGLALVSASKYTYSDIQYLGISEIILGLTGVFLLGYGLLIWAIGFGMMHIIYGLSMYFKYDKKT